jgi:hypothetical protein
MQHPMLQSADEEKRLFQNMIAQKRGWIFTGDKDHVFNGKHRVIGIHVSFMLLLRIGKGQIRYYQYRTAWAKNAGMDNTQLEPVNVLPRQERSNYSIHYDRRLMGHI